MDTIILLGWHGVTEQRSSECPRQNEGTASRNMLRVGSPQVGHIPQVGHPAPGEWKVIFLLWCQTLIISYLNQCYSTRCKCPFNIISLFIHPEGGWPTWGMWLTWGEPTLCTFSYCITAMRMCNQSQGVSQRSHAVPAHNACWTMIIIILIKNS